MTTTSPLAPGLSYRQYHHHQQPPTARSSPPQSSITDFWSPFPPQSKHFPTNASNSSVIGSSVGSPSVIGSSATGSSSLVGGSGPSSIIGSGIGSGSSIAGANAGPASNNASVTGAATTATASVSTTTTSATTTTPLGQPLTRSFTTSSLFLSTSRENGIWNSSPFSPSSATSSPVNPIGLNLSGVPTSASTNNSATPTPTSSTPPFARSQSYQRMSLNPLIHHSHPHTGHAAAAAAAAAGAGPAAPSSPSFGLDFDDFVLRRPQSASPYINQQTSTTTAITTSSISSAHSSSMPSPIGQVPHYMPAAAALESLLEDRRVNKSSTSSSPSTPTTPLSSSSPSSSISSSAGGIPGVSTTVTNGLNGIGMAPTSVSGGANAGNAAANSSNNRKKSKPSTNTELYKTELCASYMSTGGNCPYGEKCQFAHGESELKIIDRPPKWRSKPCQNWSKHGSCSYNDRCCFRHDV